jgi:hypothetical protein
VTDQMWVVVNEDRHRDDVLTVHPTEASARAHARDLAKAIGCARMPTYGRCSCGPRTRWQAFWDETCDEEAAFFSAVNGDYRISVEPAAVWRGA